jgi:hypothetical protein
MAAQTKLPPMPSVKPEARPVSQSPAPTKEIKATGRGVYWGDRLTLNFWLLCFGLMFGINVIEGLYWMVLSLLGRAPAP